MSETESEFGQYTGDCVWAAVHMAAHRLNPTSWPLGMTILNRLTSEAIAAGIGVGSRGQATPGQLKTMLSRWGMRYSVGWDYNGQPIPGATLKNILDSATLRGKPVLLGMWNGQALPGDEAGLQGHEIAVLHPDQGWGFACGDGDNPKCAAGELVYYNDVALVAARIDTAYVLEEVPAMAWTKQANGWGVDAHGHTCGGAMMQYLESRPDLAAADGLLSETYVTGALAFLPLANEHVVTSAKDSTGHWLAQEHAASVLVEVWNLYQAAKNTPAAAAAPDAATTAAVAAIQALAAALAAK